VIKSLGIVKGSEPTAIRSLGMLVPVYLIGLALAGCSTVPKNDLLEYRASLEAQTDTKMFECECPRLAPFPGAPELKFYAGRGTHRVGEGQFADGLPVGIESNSVDGDLTNEILDDYARYLGPSSIRKDYNGIYCWTGTCGGASEYSFTNVDDIKILRVFVGTRPNIHAHQCTFAENPKLLTTEPCPDIPSASEFKLLKERQLDAQKETNT